MRGLFLAVQHRLAEAGTHQCIAEAGDVGERADVRRRIGMGEGIAQLPQGLRPERRHQQQAIRLQHATEAGEQCIEILDPLHAQVGEQHVHRRLRQRQCTRICTDLCGFASERVRQPAHRARRGAARLPQHRQGEVERHDLRLRPTLLHRDAGAAGAAAEVEHALRRFALQRGIVEIVQRFQQTGFHRVLQLRRGVVAGRRARERAAHLFRVEERCAHAPCSARKSNSTSATSAAWVRNGACPACSTCT